MTSDISIQMDEVIAALARITQLHDGLPNPVEVEVIEGAGIWPTAPFRTALDQAAKRLGVRVTKTQLLLSTSHDQIAQAVKDLVAADASLADDAVGILSVLESVPTPASKTIPGATQGQQIPAKTGLA